MNWFLRILIVFFVKNHPVFVAEVTRELVTMLRDQMSAAHPVRFGRNLTRRERDAKRRRYTQRYTVAAKKKLTKQHVQQAYSLRHARFEKIRNFLEFFKGFAFLAPHPRQTYA